MTRLTRIYLALAGLTVLAVGIGGALFPTSFQASAGIDLRGDPALISEIRGAGGLLLVQALLILSGALRAGLTPLALALSVTVYLGYGFARMLGIVAEGLPSAHIATITALELGFGMVGLWLWRASRLRPRAAASA